MDNSDEIERLMRLKRYESPDQEYFDRFRAEFRDRQRAGMLRVSARQLLMERMGVWFSQCTLTKCAWPIGAMTVVGLTSGWLLFSNYRGNTASTIVSDRAQTNSQRVNLHSPQIEDFAVSLPQVSPRIPKIPNQTSDNQASNSMKILPAGIRMGLREL